MDESSARNERIAVLETKVETHDEAFKNIDRKLDELPRQFSEELEKGLKRLESQIAARDSRCQNHSRDIEELKTWRTQVESTYKTLIYTWGGVVSLVCFLITLAGFFLSKA